MPRLLSEALGVDKKALEDAGVFNGFVDLDSRFHIDPHLLASSGAPELAGSRETFDKHFGGVFALVKASKKRGDIFWSKAVDNLIFAEIPNTGLGYSKDGKSGSAIGVGLAIELADLAGEIIGAGCQDPTIFDLVGLLQEGVGADRISDMTAAVVRGHILAFSARVAQDLKLGTVKVTHGDAVFLVPKDPVSGASLYLVPADILRHLPVANSWSDIDIVSSHNSALRHKVNGLIGDTWRKATKKVKKAVLRKTLLDNPELLADFLKQYRDKQASAYDFVKDPDALIRWYEEAVGLANKDPLQLDAAKLQAPETAIEVVKAICQRYKEMVEANRLSRLLYNDNGEPKKEKAAQLVFYAIADAYCQANNLDISPEVDGGAGSVDFKFSKGYSLRINVEIKLSSNSQLVHGLEQQLPAYDAAEKSLHSIYLLIQTTATAKSIARVVKLAQALKASGKRVPDVWTVDGRLKASASNL
ncbi:MAG TPA: hypothetical protein VN700_02230 [Vicinamibacterales bacterium]|nr:hypothetical protein [Vicinamibacterales bacterium]